MIFTQSENREVDQLSGTYSTQWLVRHVVTAIVAPQANSMVNVVPAGTDPAEFYNRWNKLHLIETYNN